MKAIVAVDKNWGIGKDNNLLCRLSADMKYFCQITLGHTLILGRKTLESFPNKNPLPDRKHIVLTNNHKYEAKDVEIYYSIEGVLKLLKTYNSEEVFVIGGGSIYRQFLPYCDTAYVTKIEESFSADTFFPNLDEEENWVLAEKGKPQIENGIPFSFDIYKNKSPLC